MRKFLGSLFRNESDDPPLDVPNAPIVPQIPRKVYGDAPTPDSEIVLKIVLIGGATTGKTSIVRRYLQGCFTHQYIPTIGVDMSTAKLQTRKNPEAEYRIQFWDVAHAEVRGKHHANIFRGAIGIVMVFDCCNVQSVTAVDDWRLAYEDCARNATRIPMVLLANKSDIGPPVIKPADLDTYCERGGYAIWRFTSSRSGNSVVEALDKLLDISIEFRDIQQASRVRRKPEKLISSKSQLLSPPLRATITNPSTSALGTSYAGTSYVGSSLGTTSSSAGSSVTDNGYVSSPTMNNTNASTTAATMARLASASSAAPLSPSSTVPTTTLTTPVAYSKASDKITPVNVNTERHVNNKEANTATSSYANEATSDITVSPDAYNDTTNNNTTTNTNTSDSTSDTDTNPPTSNHTSRRNSVGIMRSSGSMDFAYLHAEGRPSILAITNALAVEEIKLGELVNLAEEFYSRLKEDLDQLFMNVKPERKSDLQILEFQRFDEYVKLVEALRVQKDKSIHEGDAYSDATVKKPGQEHLQILLSENMKKWNQLIMNLHTEVSLHKSGVFDDASLRNSNSKVRGIGNSMKTSASDTMLYSRYEEGQNLAALTSSSNTVTTSSSPKSKENSGMTTPTADQGDLLKRTQPNATRRMGFGFRNIGKNPSAIFQLVNPSPTSYSLDADNISSPPSPCNSVPSPIPSSPSTSPTSSPPFYHSRTLSADSQSLSASSSGTHTPSSSTHSMQDSQFRAHMETNGHSKHKSHATTHRGSRSNSVHHARSASLPTTPTVLPSPHATTSTTTLSPSSICSPNPSSVSSPSPSSVSSPSPSSVSPPSPRSHDTPQRYPTTPPSTTHPHTHDPPTPQHHPATKQPHPTTPGPHANGTPTNLQQQPKLQTRAHASKVEQHEMAVGAGDTNGVETPPEAAVIVGPTGEYL